MLKVSAFYLDKQKSFVPKNDSTPWLAPIDVNQVESFMKPHKISAFYLDKQKSFVPKKFQLLS